MEGGKLADAAVVGVAHLGGVLLFSTESTLHYNGWLDEKLGGRFRVDWNGIDVFLCNLRWSVGVYGRWVG